MSSDLTSPSTPGEPELDAILRRLLRSAIQVCGLNRKAICGLLTSRLGRKISPYMLDAWTADAKSDWHLPADIVPLVSEILQDDAIQRQLLSPELRQALELGESAARLFSLLQKAVAEAKQLGPNRRGVKRLRRCAK